MKPCPKLGIPHRTLLHPSGDGTTLVRLPRHGRLPKQTWRHAVGRQQNWSVEMERCVEIKKNKNWVIQEEIMLEA